MQRITFRISSIVAAARSQSGRFPDTLFERPKMNSPSVLRQLHRHRAPPPGRAFLCMSCRDSLLCLGCANRPPTRITSSGAMAPCGLRRKSDWHRLRRNGQVTYHPVRVNVTLKAFFLFFFPRRWHKSSWTQAINTHFYVSEANSSSRVDQWT